MLLLYQFRSSVVQCGPAPHFKEELIKCVNISLYFIISFDQNFNEEQMDLLARCVSDDVRKVCTRNIHCVKSVRIRSYSGPCFPAFGLNTERYSVSLRI